MHTSVYLYNWMPRVNQRMRWRIIFEVIPVLKPAPAGRRAAQPGEIFEAPDLGLAWVWIGFGETSILLIPHVLLALDVGFGWLWAKSKSLILNHLLALVLALGFTDSKGLVGFGEMPCSRNRLVFNDLKISVALARGAPGLHFFAFWLGCRPTLVA